MLLEDGWYIIRLPLPSLRIGEIFLYHHNIYCGSVLSLHMESTDSVMWSKQTRLVRIQKKIYVWSVYPNVHLQCTNWKASSENAEFVHTHMHKIPKCGAALLGDLLELHLYWQSSTATEVVSANT